MKFHPYKYLALIGVLIMLTSFEMAQHTAAALKSPTKDAKASAELIVHYFVDDNFKGEINHADGVIKALEEECRTSNLSLKPQKWDVKQYDEFVNLLKKRQPNKEQTDK